MKEISLEKAFELLEQADRIASEFIFPPAIPLKVHGMMVASAAYLIASQTTDLDPQKAYIMGLLHDFGRQAPDKEFFHGLRGYLLMKEMGYDQQARICLTHTFLINSFTVEDYPSYPKENIIQTIAILNDIVFDDYDRLIQLSDMLVFGCGFATIKERMNYLHRRYQLPASLLRKQYRHCLLLKNYFDHKCNKNIYTLLGIKDGK